MADNRQSGAAGATLILSGTAAVASIIAATKKAAAAAPTEFPPEVLSLLQAIAEAVGVTVQDLEALLAAVQGLSFNVQGYPPNADYPLSGRIDCQVALQPYRLPPIDVPDDFSIVIKSWPNNPAPPALIYVAKASGEAINPYSIWPLIQNEQIPYRIKDASQIWVAATVVPAAIVWTVEQRR